MEWINIKDQKPEIGSLACAPIPSLDNIIAGRISWGNEVELYRISSIDGTQYYIMDKWMPLPEAPKE